MEQEKVEQQPEKQEEKEVQKEVEKEESLSSESESTDSEGEKDNVLETKQQLIKEKRKLALIKAREVKKRKREERLADPDYENDKDAKREAAQDEKLLKNVSKRMKIIEKRLKKEKNPNYHVYATMGAALTFAGAAIIYAKSQRKNGGGNEQYSEYQRPAREEEEKENYIFEGEE